MAIRLTGSSFCGKVCERVSLNFYFFVSIQFTITNDIIMEYLWNSLEMPQYNGVPR